MKLDWKIQFYLWRQDRHRQYCDLLCQILGHPGWTAKMSGRVCTRCRTYTRAVQEIT